MVTQDYTMFLKTMQLQHMVTEGYGLYPWCPSFQAEYLITQLAVQGGFCGKVSKARYRTGAGGRASGQFRTWSWLHAGAPACPSLGYPGVSTRECVGRLARLMLLCHFLDTWIAATLGRSLNNVEMQIL